MLCIVGLIFGFLFIDDVRLGRKKLLMIGFTITSISSGICFYCRTPNFLFFFLVGLTKLFINLSYNVVYIFTTELYDSSIRVTALGFLKSFCMLGGVFMP